jgi:DNA sulfur modification protein DndB
MPFIVNVLMKTDNNYCYSFPAVRGQQAGRSFYIATCPLRLVPRIFVFDETEVPAELRAQRTLNQVRIPDITRYLLDNPKDYVFSAITASVALDVQFSETGPGSDLGTLLVPMDAQILINDGQHRRKAIEEAIKENPELGQDNIAVVFFVDEGLKRSQQMFADLNKHSVRPSPSLSALYDWRDSSSALARQVANEVAPFIGFTEMEQTSVAPRSSKIFTLSAIKQANQILLGKTSRSKYDDADYRLVSQYWTAVYQAIAEWQMVQHKQLSPSALRQDFIHAHGIGLQALATVGRDLLSGYPGSWLQKVERLSCVDWRKTNKRWAGKAIVSGRLSKTVISIRLTANVIKQYIGVELSVDDQQYEQEFEQ